MDFLLLLVAIFLAGALLMWLGKSQNDYLLEMFAPVMVFIFTIIVLFGAGMLLRFIAHV